MRWMGWAFKSSLVAQILLGGAVNSFALAPVAGAPPLGVTYHDSRPVVDFFDGPVLSDIWSAPRIEGANATYGFDNGHLVFSSGVTTIGGGGASFELSTWPLVAENGSYSATLNFAHDLRQR